MLYLLVNGQQSGPYTREDLQRMVRQGAVGGGTLYWENGMSAWQQIAPSNQFRSLHNSTEMSSPLASIQQYAPAPVWVQPVFVRPAKSRVGFVLLGLFLGGLGIHNFYAGYTGKAITQLLLNLFLFWTLVVPIGVGLWVLIEVITINHDANGVRMG